LSVRADLICLMISFVEESCTAFFAVLSDLASAIRA
jgi:hypothetical protein